MSRLNMISKLSMHDFDKCEYCSQSKITKTSHKFIIRKFKLLNLIHSEYLCVNLMASWLGMVKYILLLLLITVLVMIFYWTKYSMYLHQGIRGWIQRPMW